MSTFRTLFPPAALAALVTLPQAGKLGYDDTPIIPGTKWHVHDGKRPQPRIVTPGKSPDAPPSDATVLFDGTDLSAWKGLRGDAAWKVESGYMEVPVGRPRAGDIETKEHFGDCQLHIEWCTPSEVKGNSQGRGNSGVFLMGRYEVQILDSYDNRTYPDGQAGALYGQSPPLVNACRGPGEWQSYDIVFEAPRFDDKKLVRPAYVTVFHNGVLLHHKRAILGGTQHRRNASYRPHPPTGPIKLQDHGNPMRFRNVWVRALTAYDAK